MSVEYILLGLGIVVATILWAMHYEGYFEPPRSERREYKPTCSCWGAASPSEKARLQRYCSVHGPNRF